MTRQTHSDNTAHQHPSQVKTNTPSQDPPETSTTLYARNTVKGPNITNMYASTSYDDKMTIAVEICNKRGKFLVDTGSEINAIHISFVKSLTKTLAIQPPGVVSITTVDGNTSPIFGTITLTVSIESNPFRVFFYVIRCGDYDGILGRNFLSQNHALIDASKAMLSLKTTNSAHLACLSVPLGSTSSNQPNDSDSQNSLPAFVVNALTVPPNSQMLIEVSVQQSGPQTELLLEGIKKLSHHDIVIARSVSTAEEGKLPCRLMNVSPFPVFLQKGMQIGTATTFSPSIEVNAVNAHTNNTDPLVFNIDTNNLDKDQQNELMTLLYTYDNLFSVSDMDLGCTTAIEHHIKTDNSPPFKSRPYRVNHETREKLKTHIEEMLEQDIIEESCSPWASPIILVKKKDGSDRFVCDFRRLNSVTIRDSYPLPRIDDSIDALGGSVFFSTLDLRSGYWQVPVARDSRPYTAFTSYEGLYQFKRLPFGLTNAPATFQRLMEMVLRGLNWKICLIYLDDIICFSTSFNDHLKRLREVFDRLLDNNLKLKPSKCYFCKREVQFLGHVVNKNGISPSPEKTDLISKCPPPKTPKQVKQMLGLVGYYRRFVPNFAQTALPLTKLLQKNSKFKWTAACQAAFDSLKTALITPPILAFPVFAEPFHLYTDASGEAIGMILGQIINGNESVIAFAGRVLSKPERNYSVTEIEALAVIEGVKHFHCYLYGSKFTIHTDHSSLKWLFTSKELKGRAARWALTLQGYDFEIKHRPGKENQNADALSRMQTPAVCAINKHPYNARKVRERQRADPELVQLILYLEKQIPYTMDVPTELSHSNSDNFFLDSEGILYKLLESDKPYDPSSALVVPTSLRKEILEPCHDSPLVGHFGFDKTYRKIKLNYFWPKMYTQIKDWVATCVLCSKRKRNYGFKPAPLNPIPIGMTFERWAMDILGLLPVTTSGNKYILLFQEYRTKWVEGCSLPTIESKQIAKAFFELIITRYGAPDTILSDRGANFLSSLMHEIYKLLNVDKINTSSYRPQTDGMVERMNGTLTQSLSMYTNKYQDNWDTFLPGIFFGFRTSVSAATNESPYLLLFGRHPRLPLDVSLLPPTNLTASNSEYHTMIVKNLAIAQDLAAQEISKKQHNMKDYHDKNAGQPNFTIGQKVLLHDPRNRKGLSRKLAPHYLGPCTIIDQKSPVLFQITGLPDNRMHDVVHVDRLKPFHENHKLSLRTETNEHTKSSPPQRSDRDSKLPEDTQLTDQPAALNPSSAAPDNTPPALTILDHRCRRKKWNTCVKNREIL